MIDSGILIEKNEKVVINKSQALSIQLLCSILWPVIDSYWATLVFSYALERRLNLTYE